MTDITTCVVDGRLDVNVALNRPSWLSSTYTGTGGTNWPRHGNDGDKTNCNGTVSSNSVAHTQIELNPWFGVDLGVALYVAGVRLTNRADGFGKYLSYYYVIKRSCFVLVQSRPSAGLGLYGKSKTETINVH